MYVRVFDKWHWSYPIPTTTSSPSTSTHINSSPLLVPIPNFFPYGATAHAVSPTKSQCPDYPYPGNIFSPRRKILNWARLHLAGWNIAYNVPSGVPMVWDGHSWAGREASVSRAVDFQLVIQAWSFLIGDMSESWKGKVQGQVFWKWWSDEVTLWEVSRTCQHHNKLARQHPHRHSGLVFDHANTNKPLSILPGQLHTRFQSHPGNATQWFPRTLYLVTCHFYAHQHQTDQSPP